MIRRFASSGHGRARSCVRSPASTCASGTRAWNAANAAEAAVVVSPCTSTMLGFQERISRSTPARTFAAKSERLCPDFIAWRSVSGHSPKASRTEAIAPWCCPERHTRTSAWE
jgi:hypothetical protein